MTVPYTFANQSGNIPLAELDTNFANVKAAADTAGVVTTNAQPNITSVGVLTSLSVSGNVTGGNATFGNATANNFIGTFVGNISNAVYATTAGLATSANVVVLPAQTNITSVGTLTGLSVSGNITTDNLSTVGTISATGNVTGNYFIGDGSQLTNLPTGNYSNSNVAAYLPTYTGNVASGNLLSTGKVSVAGNITGANIIGYSFYANGIISASGNVDAKEFHGSLFGNNVVSNITITNDDHFQFNVANVANVVYINDGGMIVDGGVNGFISASGNVIAANVVAVNDIYGANVYSGGIMSATGAIFGANAIIDNTVFANIVGANIHTGNIVSVGGNIHTNTWVVANYIGSTNNIRIYNGNLLVAAGNVSASGNIIGGNLDVSGTAKTGVFTTGTLPNAATAGAGARALVTDANSNTFGNLYVGSSGNTIPVWSDGSNWYIG